LIDRSPKVAWTKPLKGELRRRSGLQATAVAFLDPCLAVSFEDGSGVLLPVKNYSEFDGFEAEDFTRLKVGYPVRRFATKVRICMYPLQR
jgi:hypothetical protein